MPDNPLVSWLNALVSGQAHPWRESLASGAQYGTTTTTAPSTTTTTRPDDTRDLFAALAAESGDVADEDFYRRPERRAAQRREGRRPVGEGRKERLENTLQRLMEEGKLIDAWRDENGVPVREWEWNPYYFPTRGEARTVGTAFLQDMIGWRRGDESIWPPDPYRTGWQYDGGWYPPGPGDEGTGYHPRVFRDERSAPGRSELYRGSFAPQVVR